MPTLKINRGLRRHIAVQRCSVVGASGGWPTGPTSPLQHSSSVVDPDKPVNPVPPLARCFLALLRAVQQATTQTAAAARAAAGHIAGLQVWLGKPEALLFREGCQLLACLMFILLYVWRYVTTHFLSMHPLTAAVAVQCITLTSTLPLPSY